jgi:hypothetical protein
MAGLNPSSADDARPRPALLVANEDPASDEAVPVVDLGGMRRGLDLDAVERAAGDFLAALGIDLDREERRATPARMARAHAELLAARPFRLTTFPNEEGYDELVLARAIPFRTLCEYHMRDGRRRRRPRAHHPPVPHAVRNRGPGLAFEGTITDLYLF